MNVLHGSTAVKPAVSENGEDEDPSPPGPYREKVIYDVIPLWKNLVVIRVECRRSDDMIAVTAIDVNGNCHAPLAFPRAQLPEFIYTPPYSPSRLYDECLRIGLGISIRAANKLYLAILHIEPGQPYEIARIPRFSTPAVLDFCRPI